MKIKISAKTLKEILGTVGSATSSRSSLPIVACVKIEALDSKVIFSANNLQAFVQLVVDTEVVEQGAICLNYEMLRNIVSQVAEGDIVITTKDLQATIQIGKQKAKMNGFDAANFPEFAENNGSSFKVSAFSLLNAINKVAFNVSSDVSRAALQSIAIKSKKGNIVVAAMDGYRFAEAQIKGEFDWDEQALIPSSNIKSLLEILKVSGWATVKKSKGNVIVACDNNGAKWESALFGSSIVDGMIPAYETIMPTEGMCEFIVSTNTLKHIVSMAKVYTGDTKKMSFEFDGEHLFARATHAELGEYFSGEIQTSSTSGQPLTIVLSVQFLSDILNAVNTDSVKVWLTPKKISAVFEKDNPYWIAGFASFYE